MSDYASVIERARKAFASVSKLESALTRDPNNIALQVNLAASLKLARKSELQIQEFAKYQRIDVCNYRIVPDNERGLKLGFVSRSLLEYQNLFSQIYDAIKNGPKGRAQFGGEVATESAMELAYTYSGSLGFVLLAHSERDFFEGNLDGPINTLFDILSVKKRKEVRDIAETYGHAVVKRLHDWSRANIDGHFDADIYWMRSDGATIGEMIERDRLENIVELIVDAGDEKITKETVAGILVGGDINSGSFHFIVPNGNDYRGSISPQFISQTDMTLGKKYLATIIATSIEIFATDRIERRYQLENLQEIPA